ncbi:hypothetical protein [Mycoplasma miroungirhinis]|uniref:Uncharacterized protein n=1 Tax=Mycoplasma miroungirhinis TaxID=754516 RepID=A0A6M4JA98_9MOLU|nr:hypothetical protein [Mycoplasma miroungirhinis]QJR43914.1 hypothetical protein HLA92_00375 [Mycoplasma miroungirhinis]
MENKDNLTNIRILNYIEENSNKFIKRVKLTNILESIVNFAILFLNLAVLVLSSFTIKLGIDQLKIASENDKKTLILTIFVSVSTIALFILAIIQSIYKSRAKTYSYKKIFESLFYVNMCYTNDTKYTTEEYKKQKKEILKLKDNKPNQKIKDIIINVLVGKNDNK